MFRQEVILDRPPVFDECVRRFGKAAVDRPGVIFSWGTKIYAPGGANITRELFAHEVVHGVRQMAFQVLTVPASDVHNDDRIKAWWDRYLNEPLFRLDEEIYAHHAEYKAGMKRHGHRPKFFNSIAERLSGPLYGNLLTLAQAKHAILTGEVR